MDAITVKIDGKTIQVPAGSTVLDAAKENGIFIPTLCNHPDLPPGASCRVCLVEISGRRKPATACNTEVQNGMEIVTQSEQLSTLRRTNLELIFGEHNQRCAECSRNNNCSLHKLSALFQADIDRFEYRKKEAYRLNYGSIMHLDQDKCIECANCVAICRKQNTNYLELKGSGGNTKVVPVKGAACISCAQCAMHCPVGAISVSDSLEKVKSAIADKKKTVIFQFAPAIRAAIGEEFGMPAGKAVTGRLIAALRRLGADWVVDTAIAADITTVAEATELKERILENKTLPMFTSCCPAWVSFVEMNRPDLIPNLTTVRSPHIIYGGVLKHILGRRAKLRPQEIFVVSIMPCAAKKTEIERKEMWHKGYPVVDAVLTTRELAFYLRQQGINLAGLDPEEPDSLIEKETGSGAIYGASGGVMEAALRSAYRFITGTELQSVEFKAVRGMDGIKEAEVKIGNRIIKVAVVNGLSNINHVLDKLSVDPHAYDYIEVMTCPGGCIGGGGQPIPTTDEIRKLRQQALYAIDKSNEIRLAHRDPVVKDLFKNELKDHSERRRFLETSYKKRAPQPASVKLFTPKTDKSQKEYQCPQPPLQYPGA